MNEIYLFFFRSSDSLQELKFFVEVYHPREDSSLAEAACLNVPQRNWHFPLHEVSPDDGNVRYISIGLSFKLKLNVCGFPNFKSTRTIASHRKPLIWSQGHCGSPNHQIAALTTKTLTILAIVLYHWNNLRSPNLPFLKSLNHFMTLGIIGEENVIEESKLEI